MTETGRRNPSSLRLRVLSAVVFIPLFVLLNRLGGSWYRGFILTVIAVGLVEFDTIVRANGGSSRIPAVLILGMGMATAVLTIGPGLLGPCAIALGVLFLTSELLRGHPEGALTNAGASLLGSVYVAGLGSHLGFLRDLGEGAVLFTFIVTWSGDSGAYFIGRAIGRHKLFPAVSPAKSVEGAVGGVLTSIAAAAIARAYILPGLATGHALILGGLAGVVGPIGDLCESMLKRDSGVKDSARYIPGHGGVLDRFDSLLFVAPVFYYYLKYLVLQE